MQKIYHKRNELLEVDFFKDKEYTKAFDFTDAKDLYIELKGGDLAALFTLSQEFNKFLDNENERQYLYIPYLPSNYKTLDGIKALQRSNYGTKALPQIKTLADITNFSKYIPEDNAVLFLSSEDCKRYMQCFQSRHIGLYANDGLDKVTLEGSIDAINEFVKNPIKKATIFLSHGTKSELQKASKIAKELKEKYGVEEVNVFVLHCFVSNIYEYNSSFADDFYKQNFQDAYDELCGMGCKPNVSKKEYKIQFEKEKLHHKQECFINKIITTNSTNILEPQDNEKLQVIDCFDIFNDAL
jgi:hypothetical protein